MTIKAKPLTRDAFRPYGQVVEPPPLDTTPGNTEAANQGTARRSNFVAHVANHRSPLAQSSAICGTLLEAHSDWASAQTHAHNGLESLRAIVDAGPPAVPNLCLFEVTPTAVGAFETVLLERHKYSSQLFVPMGVPRGQRYLIIAALNDPATDRPDMATLAAFEASGRQGYNLDPGVWHHPLIALDHPALFACLVHERRGTATLRDEDTEVVPIVPAVHVLTTVKSRF